MTTFWIFFFLDTSSRSSRIPGLLRRLMFMLSFACSLWVHVGFLLVLHVPHTSQKHMDWWIGYVRLLQAVYVCARCVLWLTGIPYKVYSSLIRCIPRISPGSVLTLLRIKRLLKRNKILNKILTEQSSCSNRLLYISSNVSNSQFLKKKNFYIATFEMAMFCWVNQAVVKSISSPWTQLLSL